jgi:hypothetical protein
MAIVPYTPDRADCERLTQRVSELLVSPLQLRLAASETYPASLRPSRTAALLSVNQARQGADEPLTRAMQQAPGESPR